MDTEAELRAGRESFLDEFVLLKTSSSYVRDYRDYYGKWVERLGVLRAVASLGSVAGWLGDSHLAWLWAGILVAAQLAEKLQSTFPVTKKRLALSRWCRKLDVLVVNAQGTWDEIAGNRMTSAQIRKATRLLRTQMQKAEGRAVPNGLPRKDDLFERAQQEAQAFFTRKYSARIEQ